MEKFSPDEKETLDFILSLYLGVTILSIAASVSFGQGEIDRKISLFSREADEIKVIDQRIAAIQEQIKSSSESVNMQIASLVSSIPKLSYQVAERTIQVNQEIERIRKAAGITPELGEELVSLYSRRAGLSKNVTTLRSSFEVLAGILRMRTEQIMFFFLIAVTLILEVMIYKTSSSIGEAPRQILTKWEKQVKKDKKIGQIRMALEKM